MLNIKPLGETKAQRCRRMLKRKCAHNAINIIPPTKEKWICPKPAICSRTQTYKCFVVPMAAPFTSVQFILSSSFSSTKPIVHTLSPRTRYTPRGSSMDGSGSSGVRIIRSVASLRTCTTHHASATPRIQLCKLDIAYQICRIIACYKCADQYCRVRGDDQDFLCGVRR